MILMLDNNEQFLQKAKGFLGSSNLFTDIFTTSNFSEALRVAKNKKPEIVLLDVLMPTKNGIDLIPEFREKVPDAKIIMLSLWDMNGYRKTAQSAGADGYVPKKKMMEELIPAIQKAVEEKQQDI